MWSSSIYPPPTHPPRYALRVDLQLFSNRASDVSSTLTTR